MYGDDSETSWFAVIHIEIILLIILTDVKKKLIQNPKIVFMWRWYVDEWIIIQFRFGLILLLSIPNSKMSHFVMSNGQWPNHFLLTSEIGIFIFLKAKKSFVCRDPIYMKFG